MQEHVESKTYCTYVYKLCMYVYKLCTHNKKRLLQGQENLSMKDTPNKGHLSNHNEYTVCSPNHIELCTNLPPN